jgi:hypothetical protein
MLSNPMWNALVFLAQHDRWRDDSDQYQVRVVSLLALVRRGFADMYPSRTEAWIEQPGVQHLIDNIRSIDIEYSFPSVAPNVWHLGVRLPITFAGNRLLILSHQKELQERATASNPDTRIMVRSHFVRKGEVPR